MKVEASSSVGFTGLLALVFIVLKLCKVINWSWLWVLSPIWISWGIGIVVFLVVLIVGAIADKRNSWTSW